MQKVNYYPIIIGIWLLLLLPIIVYAYPSSVNFVPTAQVLNPGEALLEYGNSGYPSLFGNESCDCSSVTVGLGTNIEIGADRYSDDSSHDTYLNGKYRFLSNEQNGFNLAVGAMDIIKDGKTTYYTSCSKTFNTVRTHLGYITGSYAHGIMVGADLDIGDKWWFGTDFIPGDSNYLTIGVSRSFGSSSYICFNYGFSNNLDFSENVVGITVGTLVNIGSN